MRRYNEVALQRDIHDLLQSWRPQLDASQLIFIHAPSSNNRVLFPPGHGSAGSHSPLNPSDSRIRRVPFVTQRPTFSELKRVLMILGRVYTPRLEASSASDGQPSNSIDTVQQQHQEQQQAEQQPQQQEQQQQQQQQPSSASSVAVPAPAADLETSFQQMQLAADDTATPSGRNSPASTSSSSKKQEESPLSKASKAGDADRVWRLLEAGNDPCVRDSKGRVAYVLAANKDVRDAFRRYMAAHPEQWDYTAAGVPSALTDELEAAQQSKKVGPGGGADAVVPFCTPSLAGCGASVVLQSVMLRCGNTWFGCG